MTTKKPNPYDRQLVKRQINDGPSLYELEGSAIEVITILQTLLDKYGSTVELDVETDYDSFELLIYYYTPETDAEYDRRIKRLEKARERNKVKAQAEAAKRQEREAAEAKLLQDLADKYGFTLTKES